MVTDEEKKRMKRDGTQGKIPFVSIPKRYRKYFVLPQSRFNEISVYEISFARSNKQTLYFRRQRETTKFTFKWSLTSTLFCGLYTRERRDVIERNCPLGLLRTESCFPEDSFVVLQGLLSKSRYECHVAKGNEYFVHMAAALYNFVSPPRYCTWTSFFTPTLC